MQQQPGAALPLTDHHTITQHVGALYCLHCLYRTQLVQPPVRVYLPLAVLELVVGLIPEFMQRGLTSAVRVVQVCVCVCVCARARACMRAHARVCGHEHVCLFGGKGGVKH